MLAKDLDAMADASQDEGIKKLCRRVKANYKYPVDSVLIRPDLHVVGHKNANDSMRESALDYVRFLMRARGVEITGPPVARAEAPSEAKLPATKVKARGRRRAIKLSIAKPEATLLDVFRAKEGRFAFSGFYQVDTSAFKTGVLTLDLELGLTGPDASFELCEMIRGEGGTVASLPIKKSKRLEAGASAQLVHRFPSGKVFHIGVRGHGKAGEVGAFSIRVRVRGS